MSIANITKDNNLDLFCKDLDVSGTITAGDIVIDDMTLDNLTINDTLTLPATSETNFVSGSQITGSPNFNGSSVTNFVGGSRIEGQLNVGNGAAVTLSGGTTLTSGATLTINGTNNFGAASTTTFASGSTLTSNGTATFNNGISVPNAFTYRTQLYSLSYTYTGDSSSGAVDVTFYKNGNIVSAYINGFSNIPTGPGVYQIDITTATNYLPNKVMAMAIPIEIAGSGDFGTITTNVGSKLLVISGGANAVNFPGGGSQGIPVSILFTYTTA